MREIKFRVWIPELKKFYFTQNEVKDDLDKLSFFFRDVDWCRGRLTHPEEVVLQQFTGLLDKNGKEIYEGDIIKHVLKGDIVIQLVNTRIFYILGLDSIDTGFHKINEIRPIEVIGNIYENPELLEKE